MVERVWGWANTWTAPRHGRAAEDASSAEAERYEPRYIYLLIQGAHVGFCWIGYLRVSVEIRCTRETEKVVEGTLEPFFSHTTSVQCHSQRPGVGSPVELVHVCGSWYSCCHWSCNPWAVFSRVLVPAGTRNRKKIQLSAFSHHPVSSVLSTAGVTRQKVPGRVSGGSRQLLAFWGGVGSRNRTEDKKGSTGSSYKMWFFDHIVEINLKKIG